jgi:hypothetical protein
VIEGAAQRCVVLVEGDPPATATLGRLSFRGANAEVERLQEEEEERRRRATEAAEAAEGREGRVVSDEEMAQA